MAIWLMSKRGLAEVRPALAELSLAGQTALVATLVERMFAGYASYASEREEGFDDVRRILDLVWSLALVPSGPLDAQTQLRHCEGLYPEDKGIAWNFSIACSVVSALMQFFIYAQTGKMDDLVPLMGIPCEAVFQSIFAAATLAGKSVHELEEVTEHHPLVCAENLRCLRDLEDVRRLCGQSEASNADWWSKELLRLRQRSEFESNAMFGTSASFLLQEPPQS